MKYRIIFNEGRQYQAQRYVSRHFPCACWEPLFREASRGSWTDWCATLDSCRRLIRKDYEERTNRKLRYSGKSVVVEEIEL